METLRSSVVTISSSFRDGGGGTWRARTWLRRIPIPSISPYRTPLKGLYLGSAATFPGGAVHGVPGDAA